MKKVVHLTSAHPRNDIRIFHKECISLSNHFDTTLIVNDGKGNDTINKVKIIDAAIKIQNRFSRFTKVTNAIFKIALEQKADIYHFHDPELIRIGIRLKKLGFKVIYDVHEDLSKSILYKPYIPRIVRFPLSFVIEKYEQYASKKFDALLCATAFITKKFKKNNRFSFNINNYPLLNELKTSKKLVESKSKYICYIGAISAMRGLEPIINAIENTCYKLLLAGEFSEIDFKNRVKNLNGWKNVKYLGKISRDEIQKVTNKSFAGMVTFLPTPNHTNSQPNKIFEYMSMKLPVIASNFELWKMIVEKNKCGICVNPKSKLEIFEAIDYLFKNPEKASSFGENGNIIVKNKYNWSVEEKGLINIYNKLIN